jgi:4-hydroxy-3-polyprenylbenzoate decarboxylase
MRIVVGFSGASGIIYGIRLLEVLKEKGVETHLIISRGAGETLALETSYSLDYVKSLASVTYRINDIAASVASGSFKTNGMVIIPCSMKTLSGIALGYSDNLLLRAAEVTLKERRPLILVPRETPLNLIHLRNMLRAAQAGAIILPAMPAFYHKPKTIDDLINHLVGKILDILGIEHELFKRWKGPEINKEDSSR